MTDQRYPPGWDESRVRRVLEHYQGQSEEEALAEDEAAYEDATHTFIDVPNDLLPKIRELLGRRRAS